MSTSYYYDGQTIIAVRSGMPEHYVEIGMGATYEEAVADLTPTPIQSTGRDGGVADALQWAHNDGSISDPADLEEDEGPDFTDLLRAITMAADDAAEWEGWTWAHDPGGIVTDGPGAVDDWDAWEEERRAELDYRDLADTTDMTSDMIQSALDDIAAAERSYGETAQAAADEARDLGEAATEAARAGNYDDALDLARRAARLEAAYGDDPSYAPLVAACEAIVAVA